VINKNEKVAVIIPKGFEQGLKNGQPQKIQVYTVLNNFSLSGSKAGAQAAAAVQAINDTISTSLLKQQVAGVDAAFLKNPVKSEDYVRVGQRQAQISPAVIAGFISQQTTFIPIVLFLVIIFASQMITASMASEKENKTLETLLSAPVSRQSIIAAKLVGAGLVALITATVYLISMRYYINGITGTALQASALQVSANDAIKSAAAQLGLVMGTLDYVMLGLSLFFGILAALSVSIILGSFAEDAKSAQGVIAPLMILILIPYFLTMFLDLNSLSPALRWLVFAIPFSHPFLAAPNLLLHHQANVWWGILYMAVVFMIFVYIASKIFSSDKILTMRLKFGKKQKAGI
jgi:ABC-2 type transport system permease protein